MENEFKCGFIKNYIEKNGKHFGFISEKGTKTDFYYMDSDLAQDYIPKKGDFVQFTVIQEAKGKGNARAGVINLFSKSKNLKTKAKEYTAKPKSLAPLPPPCPHCGAQKGVRFGWADDYDHSIKHTICVVCGKEHTYGDIASRNEEEIKRIAISILLERIVFGIFIIGILILVICICVK